MDESWYQQLGGRIARFRIDSKMTQEVLAEKADIAPSYLARIETGSRHPTLDVLGRLASALDLSLARIIADGDKKHAEQFAQWGKSARTIAQLLPELTDSDLELIERMVHRLHDDEGH
ncbi:MAG: helix-turn-helix transcriptional regulator [Kofleriaceae bacterium]